MKIVKILPLLIFLITSTSIFGQNDKFIKGQEIFPEEERDLIYFEEIGPDSFLAINYPRRQSNVAEIIFFDSNLKLINQGKVNFEINDDKLYPKKIFKLDGSIVIYSKPYETTVKVGVTEITEKELYKGRFDYRKFKFSGWAKETGGEILNKRITIISSSWMYSENNLLPMKDNEVMVMQSNGDDGDGISLDIVFKNNGTMDRLNNIHLPIMDHYIIEVTGNVLKSGEIFLLIKGLKKPRSKKEEYENHYNYFLLKTNTNGTSTKFSPIKKINQEENEVYAAETPDGKIVYYGMDVFSYSDKLPDICNFLFIDPEKSDGDSIEVKKLAMAKDILGVKPEVANGFYQVHPSGGFNASALFDEKNGLSYFIFESYQIMGIETSVEYQFGGIYCIKMNQNGEFTIFPFLGKEIRIGTSRWLNFFENAGAFAFLEDGNVNIIYNGDPKFASGKKESVGMFQYPALLQITFSPDGKFSKRMLLNYEEIGCLAYPQYSSFNEVKNTFVFIGRDGPHSNYFPIKVKF